MDFEFRGYCIRLRATFGLTDSSARTGRATLDVLSHGTPLYHHGFRRARSQTRTVRLEHAFTLRLEAHTSSGRRHRGYGAFGSPRVLCTR